MESVFPMAEIISYCGRMNTCAGNISWDTTRAKHRFFRGKCTFAKAYAAMEENTTAQMTRMKIIIKVL